MTGRRVGTIGRPVSAELKKTALHHRHAALGARFVPFAGWSMPVQYAGVMQEHVAVRTAAGLFDVSHMGEFRCQGADATAALQYAVTNNVERLAIGGALYTAMCQADGGIVDDLIIYREAEHAYFIVVNASRIDDDYHHLAAIIDGQGFAAVLEDISARYTLLALQGPLAFTILQQVCAAAPRIAAAKPFSFIDTEVAGAADVRVARTGYTGEPGVELYIPVLASEAVFDGLMAAGAQHGLMPVGLGARDTLRLEMNYPLYGNDIDLQHNPIEAGLGWVVKFKAGDFLGRDALLAIKNAGPARRLVAVEVTGRGIARQGYQIAKDGHTVGVVTSGTHSPSLAKAIALGYLPSALAAVGTAVDIMIRGRPVAAQVVKSPFYQQPS